MSASVFNDFESSIRAIAITLSRSIEDADMPWKHRASHMITAVLQPLKYECEMSGRALTKQDFIRSMNFNDAIRYIKDKNIPEDKKDILYKYIKSLTKGSGVSGPEDEAWLTATALHNELAIKVRNILDES